MQEATHDVLVVDDDDISRMPLVQLLERHPRVARVLQCSEAEDAWRILTTLHPRPALVCCDIVMPGISGLDLLERVRRDVVLDGLPFVMITSAADRDSVQRAGASGAAGFVVKPFDSASVTRTIAKVLAAVPGDAEPLAETSRRLGIAPDDVLRWTGRLLADTRGQLDVEPAPDDAGRTSHPLQRLHDGSRTLGLTRAAQLFACLASPDVGPEQRRRLVHEAIATMALRLRSGGRS